MLAYHDKLLAHVATIHQRSGNKLAVVRVHDISRPLLSRRVEETRRINFRPDGTLTVERGGRGRCLRDVNLDGTLVTCRNGVLASALGVLVPLKSDLARSDEIN